MKRSPAEMALKAKMIARWENEGGAVRAPSSPTNATSAGLRQAPPSASKPMARD
jgi:hypothetical protein